MSDIYITPDGSQLRSWARNYAGSLLTSEELADNTMKAFKNLHGESHTKAMVNLAKFHFPDALKHVPTVYLDVKDFEKLLDGLLKNMECVESAAHFSDAFFKTLNDAKDSKYYELCKEYSEKLTNRRLEIVNNNKESD